MVRIFFIATVLILISFNVFSQKHLQRFSIKTGLSICAQSYSPNTFGNIKTEGKKIYSPFLNLQYAIPLNKNQISIGIQVVQKGFGFDFNSPQSNNIQYQLTYEDLLNYIELPINFHFNIIHNRLKIHTGIITSYLYEANYRYKEIDITSNPYVYRVSNYSQRLDERYKKWDFGFNFGFAYRMFGNFELELSVQRHIINPDLWKSNEIMYSEVYMAGIRYAFLASN